MTLTSASALDKEISGGTKTETAAAVGKLVAERAAEKASKSSLRPWWIPLPWPRASFAEAARENGLEF